MNTFSESEIRKKVIEVLQNILKTDPATITDETKFVEDLNTDSLDKVTLLMALEDKFDREISDEEAATLTDVGNTIAFIKKKLEEMDNA